MATSSDPKSAAEGSSRDAFMSADELRQYSTQVEMARASKEPSTRWTRRAKPAPN